MLQRIIVLAFLIMTATACEQKQTAIESSGSSSQLLLSTSGINALKNSDNSIINQATESLEDKVQEILIEPVIIPQPVDAGGGYSHEKHKRNYAELYQVAISYNLNPSDEKLTYVKEMFDGYANMYPTLGMHPKDKENHPGGKLYWQGLNEAVTLFYMIQAYDMTRDFMTEEERAKIESDLLRPMAKFLSVDSYDVFNKIHNHGTWSVAAVGMTGMVLGDDDMIDRSIYGSNKDSKTGFIAQLDHLFSSDGFYSEGPYYHRYAILPFIAFAEAIENNRPDVKIFEHRDGILRKAVTTLLQLTDEQGRFYPINDAIKSKTWESDEVVFATNIAYKQYKDASLLPVIKMMNKISLTDAGAIAANAITDTTEDFYERPSMFIADGVDGNSGGLSLMRSPQNTAGQLQTVLKFSTQGMGHGHFDRLTLSVYDHGNEIIPDYGAARFLNIETKRGGRYLPENKTYAQHTIAHGAVVLDQKSQYKGNVKYSEEHVSQLVKNDMSNDRLQVTIAADTMAYDGSKLSRSITMVNDADITNRPFIIDLYHVDSNTGHQMDLNYPFFGDIIDTQFDYNRPVNKTVLGTDNGYNHLEVLAKGSPKPNSTNSQFTFLQAQRFYSITSVTDPSTELFITQTGANDPEFNLNLQRQYLIRQPSGSKNHTFVNIIEPHGFFNPIQETVTYPKSAFSELTHEQQGDYDVVTFKIGEEIYLYTLSRKRDGKNNHTITFNGKSYSWDGPHQLIKL
ncbi:heparinase II/III domain-containing protein [Nonlabens ulvanivorans]|uniref:Alginate lyase n=2 Tax=Nonlabens ulvanivorans TaxID=906888 RepID=A0A084JVC5_NONUL|nr:heparinase II/III family protein [Nonlabens ulvanivorans]KEZ92909.1 alginate lyase [Nonlabens ulvanivorans]PRX12862.1 alginate lyase [Nonlabens ulvanivorans]